MSSPHRARIAPVRAPLFRAWMPSLALACPGGSGAGHLSLMAGASGPPRRPQGPPQATASGPPQVGGAPKPPPAPRTVDPLSGRAPWDYEPVQKSLENVEEAELAPLSRFIESMGGAWMAIPIVLWCLATLGPILVMKCDIEVSAAVFWGLLIGIPYLLAEVWVYLDLQDRGGALWWLVVTLVPLAGLGLYFIVERQE